MRDDEYARMGDQGETAARTWLKRQGFWVVPTSLIDKGGAPQLEAWLQALILPDTQVFGNNGSRWVEVKTKSRATYYRKGHRWEHGIEYRHWKDYLAVQNRTKVPAWLCVVEVESCLFLLAPITRLIGQSRIYDSDKLPGGQWHIFFPRDAFDWYDDRGAGIKLITPIEPNAPRTLSQGAAPASKQLSLL